ncbi:undecaprenyl-phosphate glucose phosphotransferase [Paraglaciecola psychrophila]|uniref:Bacterial sugar transferase domain-containing protein n=1 Tax=Paraglaciecola psychrophila 170 TaxID=1129794 RepID=K7ANF7_9ALTE|nr:undecaprenyl-phosphate glucose phosphotransferase [Paraglaciecola psychrophila]AGH45541.1 hypothetical protein C427_3432 [Paraglaciecola psychrophila 170]GAC36860.1 probable CPS biosynthesis glycosyltransferase [Paraglaciecola psychrophila 170]
MVVKRGVLEANKSFITVFQRLSDIAVILCSLFLASHYLDEPWVLVHTTATILAALLFQLISEISDLYISWRGLSILKELKKTSVNWLVTVFVCFLIVDLSTLANFSQKIQIAWPLIGLFSLVVYRIILRLVISNFRSKGFNARSFVLAGGGALGQSLLSKISNNQSYGLIFEGYYDDLESHKGFDNIQRKGDLKELVVKCKQGCIDRVYITLPMRAEQRIKWLIKELADTTASVYLVPDVFTFELMHSRSDIIAGIPTISIYDSPIYGTNAIIKRIEDLVLSTIILLLITPLLIAISIAVKFTSPGPVLFKQIRYGIDGKAIKVWKFRSMTVMENGAQVIQAKKNDVRLTPIGGILRSKSLDELPQFFNVLQGKMSIVGPRPHAVAHNEEYRPIISGYMLRHKVKPGITGWAQVNGWRGETDTLEKMEKRIDHDLDYIRDWSLSFDLKIITMTIFKSFLDKSIY